MSAHPVLIALVLIPLAACSNGVPLGPSTPPESQPQSATTTPAPTPAPDPAPIPTPAPAPVTAAIAYAPDIAPIMTSDCVPCHSDQRARGHFSASSYTSVMRTVQAGNSSSALVNVTRSGGSMYGFLSGDRTLKSSLILQWVVSGAAAAR